MMKKVDYLIVGYGIAAACFARLCIAHQKTFLIIGDHQKSASHVAAGMFNPVVLHRFVPVDRAEEYMPLVTSTFRAFESLLQQKFIHYLPIYRIFADKMESELWARKIESDSTLQKYLNPSIHLEKFDKIYAPFGFGEVRHSGWIDLANILQEFHTKFKNNFLSEEFDFSLFIPDKMCYKTIQFENIIFAEGVKIAHNPYFDHLPLIKSKGEILIIRTNDQLPEIIFKSKNFLMPLGEHRYYVGSTYDRHWTTDLPTDKGKNKLVKSLSTYFKGKFIIEEHLAAFRPTTPDRRGLIGRHSKYQHLYVLNGLGTRGTFHAPFLSKNLFEYIEKGNQLDVEHDITRWN